MAEERKQIRFLLDGVTEAEYKSEEENQNNETDNSQPAQRIIENQVKEIKVDLPETQ